MKKIIVTIVLGLIIISANAQIEKLAGPRIGLTGIASGEISEELETNFLMQYGWQWESRFADGNEIAGLVEWVILVGGMEQGMFLPSVSSLVGLRSSSGFEFAAGPNLSIAGVGMAFSAGKNYTSGNLNLPVNFAFVPGVDGTGSRFSILVGFNMNK